MSIPLHLRALSPMVPVSDLPPGLEIAELSGPVRSSTDYRILVTLGPFWDSDSTTVYAIFPPVFFARANDTSDLYYQAFPKDPRFNKCLVYTVYIIEFVQTILMTSAAFDTFGYGFGDLSALRDIHFEWFTVPVMSGVVAFIGQSFYTYRLYLLSRSRWLSVLIVILALTSSVGAFIAGSFSFKVGGNLGLLQTDRNWGLGVWLGGAAFTDIIITVCLTYYLCKYDTGFHETHALVVRTTRLTIETGSVTALVAMTDVALFYAFPGKPYFIAAGSILPKLYANTMFAVLNARFQIVGGRGYTSSTDVLSFPSYVRNVEIVGGASTRSDAPGHHHRDLLPLPPSLAALRLLHPSLLALVAQRASPSLAGQHRAILPLERRLPDRREIEFEASYDDKSGVLALRVWDMETEGGAWS
ncbi:hypothetical protein B0H19DRAFT_1382538 [Mycena capillaripes]|nr:hypothetical protein B0H19DRAFT_1382538 [Mycena capillaripes]